MSSRKTSSVGAPGAGLARVSRGLSGRLCGGPTRAGRCRSQGRRSSDTRSLIAKAFWLDGFRARYEGLQYPKSVHTPCGGGGGRGARGPRRRRGHNSRRRAQPLKSCPARTCRCGPRRWRASTPMRMIRGLRGSKYGWAAKNKNAYVIQWFYEGTMVPMEITIEGSEVKLL